PISSILPTNGHLRDLHSFPTRRSSDLKNPPEDGISRDGMIPATVFQEHTHDPRDCPCCRPRFHCHVCRIRAGHGCAPGRRSRERSEEHTSELQSRFDLVCRLLLEKKKT